MFEQENITYYDLLEILPDATQADIREAYFKAKETYKKSSPALYSLITSEETEDHLRRIEEAYHVLSHPEKRREYDRHHGIIALGKVIPLERERLVSEVLSTEPESAELETEILLVAPRTDFRSQDEEATKELPRPLDKHKAAETPPLFVQNKTTDIIPSAPTKPYGGSEPPQEIQQEIDQEVEWKGVFLRRVREARGISLEELSDFTKVSRTYLKAIEEESFAKLPAAVFLRGFIIQISRYLKLPQQKVSDAYMARFHQYKASQEDHQ